jgi:hypothetical protein
LHFGRVQPPPNCDRWSIQNPNTHEHWTERCQTKDVVGAIRSRCFAWEKTTNDCSGNTAPDH